MRVIYIIDGFNLYHSIRHLERVTGYKCKWLNIRSLCESYLYLIDKSARLEDVYYFSAVPYQVTHSNPDRIKRHNLYTSCLKDTGVKVELGRFKSKQVFCQNCRQSSQAFEEKETDVAMAVKLMEVCYKGLCESVVVVSGDTDMAPAARKCLEMFPNVDVRFAFPFGRKNRELQNLAPASFIMRKKQYINHQFADPYTLQNGTIVTKPSIW